MPLESRLFRENQALQACQVSDMAHIVPGAAGDHVSKIQTALKMVNGAQIAAHEIAAKQYGPSTAAAVLAYKKARKIINFSYQTQADNITGRMTITALDKEVKAKEGPQPGPTPTPKPTLSIVPFHEPAPFLISKQPHSLAKGDLRSTPSPLLGFAPAEMVKIIAAQQLPTSQLETAMFGELFVGGGPLGSQAAIDFNRNTVAADTITKSVGGPLSTTVQRSAEFRAANADVNTFVTDALKASAATGILDYRVLAEPKKKVPPPGIGFTGFQPLHVVIGSFQGISIFLTNFTASETTRKYTADLTYELFDHFGVDDSDLIFDFRGHGSPGQIALWVLQRERHPGHMPYVLKVVINETITGDF